MITIPALTDAQLCDLGGGLIMRRSTWADAEPLADFNRWMHRNDDDPNPDEGVGVWVRELLSGEHPTFGEGDFTVVVEKDTGKIVSCLNLISQTWTYGANAPTGGIPFGVGRVELVGTLPEYRRRGLIRAQFDVVHQWSAERGEPVQAITGIPYYYRQFGYEMALSLGGGRVCHVATIPNLKEGQAERFTLRPVVEADLPFVMAVEAHVAANSLVHAVRNERLWHFELFGHWPGHCNKLEWRIIQAAGGEPVGLTGFVGYPWGANRVGVLYLEMLPGWSYVEAAAGILRGLKAEGEAVCAAKGKTLENFYIGLGEAHPFYEANHDRLAVVRPEYAWYIRVPDLLGFLQRITPALEARLADSYAAAHTGELKVSFYRSGLRFSFQRGKLSFAPWLAEPHDDEGDAGFPGLTFLQLVFGYRDLAQLRAAFPDVWAGSDEAYGLLNALFPRQRSRFLGWY